MRQKYSVVTVLYCRGFFCTAELREQPGDGGPHSCPPPFIPHSAFLQCGQQWSKVEILCYSSSLSHVAKENPTGLPMGSNYKAWLLRWEMSSLKLHRILKPVLAKRRVRS